jgi:predicted NUDIX family NTP pyrophosphohydrolase
VNTHRHFEKTHDTAMPKRSAGLLLFRRSNHLDLFLVHPGGPFWARKDNGAWSLPKGEYSEDEDALQAAKREFQEEIGISVDGDFFPLGELRQPSGKLITAWALEKDVDPALVKSNSFSMEWPPKSGKTQEFPEVDRAAWFPISLARTKLLKGQVAFINRLAKKLSVSNEDNGPSGAPEQSSLF